MDKESAANLVFSSDSCDEAWGFYAHYYAFKGSIFESYYIDNPLRTKYQGGHVVSRAGDGPYAFIKKGNERLCNLKDGASVNDPERLHGNVDFNMYGLGATKKAERLIEIAGGWTPENAEVIAEVGKAFKRSFEPWNHSLMLSTGNLQKAQNQGLSLVPLGKNDYEWLDRPDSLVYLLSRFFEIGEEEWKVEYRKRPEMNRVVPSNIKALIDYLKQFDDIYDYCNQVYGIDKELTDKMIDRGSQALQNREDVLEYLRLANDFWDARANSERGRAAINALLDSKEPKSE